MLDGEGSLSVEDARISFGFLRLEAWDDLAVHGAPRREGLMRRIVEVSGGAWQVKAGDIDPIFRSMVGDRPRLLWSKG